MHGWSCRSSSLPPMSPSISSSSTVITRPYYTINHHIIIIITTLLIIFISFHSDLPTMIKSSSSCCCYALSFQHLRYHHSTSSYKSQRFHNNVKLLFSSSSTFINKNNNLKTYMYTYLTQTTLHMKKQNNYYESEYFTKYENIEKELRIIQSKVKMLNGQEDINLNSPKQISDVLYKDYNDKEILPSGRSTTKEILHSFASYCGNDDKIALFQKDVATLVLQYRELKHMLQLLQKVNNKSDSKNTDSETSVQGTKNKIGTSRSFSTDVSTTSRKEEISNAGVHSTSNTKTSSHQIHHSTNTFYNTIIEDLFSSSVSKIDLYWYDSLQSITKPSARAIVSQLNPSCPMGYNPIATPYESMIENNYNNDNNNNDDNSPTKTTTAGKKGSLLSYVREQKEKYPDCIIITRVGEFYEAFGIDALILIEYCGLNSMAGKARAGCPLKNIQATLDCLTNNGYRVAVYEEVTDTDASLGGKGLSGGPKARIKNRMLAQIVSPASPTYLYNLVLGDSGSAGDALFGTPSARPYVGIISNAAGYTLVEVSSEERTVRVSERMTTEAVACRLSAYPPAEPLVYVGSQGEQNRSSLPFLPSITDTMRDGPGTKLHVKYLQSNLYMPSPREGVSDIERSKQCIVSALLQMTAIEDNVNQVSLSHTDFTLLPSSTPSPDCIDTNPLYVETATQLGLMTDPTIPQLVKYCVPDSAPLPTRRFLRRWLLTPPPSTVTSAMAEIVSILKNDDLTLPPMTIPPVGKVLSLIRAGQASAQVFRDVLTSLESSVSVINSYNENPNIVTPLLSILRYESGIDAEQNNLKERSLDAMQLIKQVICTYHSDYDNTNKDVISSNGNGIIPSAYFERNEASWRGRIKPENAEEAYGEVERAANELVQAVAIDYWGAVDSKDMNTAKEQKNPIVQDIFNNLIALKEIPSWAEKENYYHPRDRNGKLLRNRYTTSRVDDAISSYVEACDFATSSVSSVLSKLSETLCETGHLPAISQAAHINLILSTVTHHAIMANHLGWNMAQIATDNCNDAFHFQNLWPYWMDKSESVLNSFDLDGMFLLTAPNMSGKSTIMRSTAAAALLTNCGLCAPLEGGTICRFDNIFVRGASSDIPTENKSAFGAEMQDIAALFRACGDKSLVFVDELGRGTSPTDGTSLAAAVLEEMAACGMKGFFATHLHGILDLPLSQDALTNIKKKQMETSDESWTYIITDGVCTDSQAFKTAAKFGMPDNIIQRAKGLSYHAINATLQNKISLEKDAKLSSVEKSLDDQVEMALQIVEGFSDRFYESAVRIPPNWTAPPSLEGNSVVYVMLVNGKYYIGETDSLSRRMRQHRSKNGWSEVSTIAVRVQGGKTSARNLESLMIRKFASEGLPLISVTDGQTISPKSRQAFS